MLQIGIIILIYIHKITMIILNQTNLKITKISNYQVEIPKDTVSQIEFEEALKIVVNLKYIL